MSSWADARCPSPAARRDSLTRTANNIFETVTPGGSAITRRQELVEHFWPKFESGAIRPHIHRVLPLAQADEAQQILYRGKHVGKVVLRVRKPIGA